ncbi:hypothetical protein H6G52_03790 [Limnothrix sp. FACHB-881]|uniref:hypothetical protein n=1 Tax=Limnothrix sp. FACHB-881 TaxID=2692819 RepID=UPI001685CA20|nr:hypothetical protein [Limnothrix sp. FACHB-881]MBD2634473.1 hypothetical protein [Limnothrix sp. FACHB-881]
MSEENTTENQAPIDPELSASSELEDGELSEEELDAQSGGTGALLSMEEMAKAYSSTPDLTKPEKQANSVDSSYTSYFGNTGANKGSELSSNVNVLPLNLTSKFP